MTLTRWLSRLPYPTAIGCGLALMSALAYLFWLPTCRQPSDFSVVHPLAPFVACAMPALGGLWLDWARLYPVTRSTVVRSGLGLLLALGLAGAGAVMSNTLLGPAIMIAIMMAVLIGARVLWWLATRGRSSWRVAEGEVRRDEVDRLVVRAPDGEVVELARDATDLGALRSNDISIGASLAVLGRFERVIDGDPFRSEVRFLATRVAAAAPNLPALRRTFFGRARAWAAYASLLALLSLGVGAGLDYGPGAQQGCELSHQA